MKMMKKIGAIMLAIMMLAVCVTAFASGDAGDAGGGDSGNTNSSGANMTGESGVIGEFTTPDQPVTQSDTVVIYKEITAYNPENSTVNAPTITYNYTISAATVASGTTVTDNASRHNKNGDTDVTATVAVKAGVGTPTITGTGAGVLAITPSDQLAASQYGTANRFALTVDFSSIDWATTGSGAGVYRYQIDETTTEAKNASGIKEGEVANTLYIDVYVDGSGNVYGYVLFTTNTTIDGSTSEATAATTAGKIEGFVDDADNHVYTSTDTSTADKYYTFNLDLTKVVSGDAYASSTHHEFPFTVTLANTSVTAAVLPIMTVGSNATQADLSAAAIGGQNWTPTIADGATVSYVGIPCGTTVTVYETNDVTGVSYNSVSTNADTNAAAKTIDTNETSNTATINCGATALTAATDNHTGTGALTFTNTLIQISPTGIALRYAPYLLILVGGIALLLVAKKHKKHNTDEE